MISAFLTDASGVTEQRVEVPSIEFLDPSAYGEGKVFVLFDPDLGNIEEFETELVGEEFVIVPRPVDEVMELAYAKIALRERVKTMRDAVEWGGIAVPRGRRIDTNVKSQGKIAGGALDAFIAITLGESWAETWWMEDGTPHDISAAEMVGIGRMVKTHVSACQQRKGAIDAAIEAAADMSVLEAIDIESGWPG